MIFIPTARLAFPACSISDRRYLSAGYESAHLWDTRQSAKLCFLFFLLVAVTFSWLKVAKSYCKSALPILSGDRWDFFPERDATRKRLVHSWIVCARLALRLIWPLRTWGGHFYWHPYLLVSDWTYSRTFLLHPLMFRYLRRIFS